MVFNSIQFKSRKDLIRRTFALLICISMIFALSSCVRKGTDELSQNQETGLPTSSDQVNAAANTSDDQKEGAYIVLKDKLDTDRPYIKIYDAYGAVSYAQLDDNTADDLRKDLSTMEETDISAYVGTENDYFPENIYLYIGNKLKGEQTDFGSGYSVLMNSEGRTCLRDFDEGIDYYADDVCKRLVTIAKQLGVIPYITKDNISSVIKAELKVDDVKQLEITDKETLEKLERMFQNSERIVNPGTYNISSVLTLINADGKGVDIELDDVSDICIIGHTYWYDYGPGTDGDNSRNSRNKLFNLLGIADWSEINSD